MSKNKIIIGAAGLTAIIAVIGIAATSYAAGGRGMGIKFGKNFSPQDNAARQEAMAQAETDRETMVKALTDNDYNAWQTLMNQKKDEMQKNVDEFSAKINEDTFSKLVQIQKLMSEGSYDEANKLRQELGFGFGFGFDFGRGFKAGWNK
ncbi:MAG: hypothetical protein PHZ04_01510 [Patescibacteria group bacterium]|nr:hypothetical protein [Patescibacteria group bacterium]MDD5294772.1 hypothetical protein [Patescibacteria group bacterium]MDD5554344.1 hypothetical protein [Patescibacteria group bacterium]